MSIRSKVIAFLATTALAATLAPVGLALADEPALQAGDIAVSAQSGGSSAPGSEATPSTDRDSTQASTPATHADGWEKSDGTWHYWRNDAMVTSKWVITSTAPKIKGAAAGTHRYWIDADGNLACRRLVDTSTAKDAAAGYCAYATKSGQIAVGKKSVGDKVYLAKANGELETGNDLGMLDSDKYGDGEMHRYFIDKDAHAAITGKVVKVRGFGLVYAYPKKGYIARGVSKFDSKHLLLATSEGKLGQKPGWVTSRLFADGTPQKYYMEPTTKDKNVYGARIGLFKVEGFGKAYAFPETGYIVRGIAKIDKNHLLLATSEGKLGQKPGWVTSRLFADGTAQRYYMEPTNKIKGLYGARTGFFTIDGWGSAYAYPSTGYVVRGTAKLGSSHVLLADGEGKLRQEAGWVTTDAYGNGEQRYYVEATKKAGVFGARTGLFSVDGLTYFADSTGAVFRNGRKVIDSVYYNADENGALWRDEVISRMWREAQGYSSPSQYLLMVDTDDTKTIVFEGSQGNWDIKFIWDCSTGAPETPTVLGTFQVGLKGYSFGEDHGYSCYYWTQFYGDYLFHTRIYWANTHDLRDVSMNTRVSQGCVRLYDEDAKWIWDNVPTGTTVVTLE